MASITVAKAMKVKNRLAGRFTKVSADVLRNNSVLKAQVGQVAVAELVEVRKALQAAIIDIKTAISEGSSPIRRDLFALAELKGSLTFYQGLNTRHGLMPHDYAEKEVEYVATITKTEQDQEISALEVEIDKLQDKIDEFNAGTTITVADATLALAQK